MKQNLSKYLLNKYNIPGPRYTSYPTVPYWESSPTQEEWISSIQKALSESEKLNIGAALYVHIPFCQALCTYCGCNTRITRNQAVGMPYVRTVLKEWETYRTLLGSLISQQGFLKVSEIHLGGGTPTFLNASELAFFLDELLKTIQVGSDHEFSIEVDPRVTNREQLKTLAERGFKRLSLGIQDFDPKVQEIVHRVQSFEEVQKLTEQARELGFVSINYDLIYGLPFQTKASVQDTIEKVNRLRPDRIAFYAYAHVPWIKPSQRRFTEGDLPSGDEKRGLYELGRSMLEASGYQEIGMDHFALKTDSLSKAISQKTLHRNFMGYTSRQVAPLIGLGVSAIGDAWTAFMQNEKVLETYEKRVNEGELPIFRGHVLTDEDLVIRRHVLNLMTQMNTSWENKKDPTLYTPYLDVISEKLSELSRDGLVKLTTTSCEITEPGRAFLRNICMAFDARLARKAPQTKLFSQTI